MRHDLRRGPGTAYVMIFVSVMAGSLPLLWLTDHGFSVWIPLLSASAAISVYVANEANWHFTNYAILHETSLDVRQDLPGRRFTERTRIPYSYVLRLRVRNDTEVEVVYARLPLTGDATRDMEALVFQPHNPHAFSIDLQGRVDRALAAFPA